MNVNRLAASYLNLYTQLRNRLDAKHACKKTHRFIHGKRVLTAAEQKELKTVFAGCGRFDSVFHAFYKEKTGRFEPYQLPTDLYYKAIDPYFNSLAESKVLDNKCLYGRLFPNIAQAETVVLRMGGLWYDSDRQLLSIEKVKDILSEEPAVFMKAATRSCGGKGVRYIDSSDGLVADKFLQTLKSMPDDIVVQRPLCQHAALGTINESSVNTLRILSLLTENGVKIYSSVLRMGVAGSKVDNASSGGITCGIAEDGRLKKYAYKPNGERFTAHPTSGVVFEGYTIPHFEAAKELVEKAHPMMPHFRMVSWDVAIDENGDAVMIEANFAKGELDFHQLNNGPLFGEDTKKILDEVFGKTK